MELFETSASLMVKSMVLGTRWAGRRRVRYLESTAQARGQVGELQADILSLRDRVERLTSRNQLLLRRTDPSRRTR